MAATDHPESRDVVCKQSSSSDDVHDDNQVSDDDNDDNRYLVVLPDAPVSNRSSSVSSIESIGNTNTEHCYAGLNMSAHIAESQDTNTNIEHYYLDVLPDDTDNQVPQNLPLKLKYNDEDDNENRYLVVLPDAPISNRSSSVSSIDSNASAEHCYAGLNAATATADADAKQSST